MRREEMDELVALREMGRPARVALEQEGRFAELVERVFERAAVVQRAAEPAEKRPRAAMRSRRAVSVRVAWAHYDQRGVTVDVGGGGFGALLGGAPPRGSTVTAWLELGKSRTVEALVRVVDLRERHGTTRASFGFVAIAEEDLAVIREALLDDALAELSRAGSRSPIGRSA